MNKLWLCLWLPVVCLAGCLNRSEPEPVLFGQIVPLSGPDRAVGERIRNGLILAVEDANRDENRVLGRRVAVLTPDGGSNVEDIRHKAVRLVTIDRALALLGGAGWEQLEGLSSVAQSHHVPVIVASGYVQPSVEPALMELGVDGILEKPFTSAALLERVRRALGEKGTGKRTPTPKLRMSPKRESRPP